MARPAGTYPVAAWRARYEAGASVKQIAATASVGASTVRLHLISDGTAMRSSRTIVGVRYRTSAWHATAIEMRAGGATRPVIARALNKTVSAVDNAIRRPAHP